MSNTMLKLGAFVFAITIVNIVLGMFVKDYFSEISASLNDAKWWAGSMLTWVIFSIIIAAGVKVFTWLENMKYRNAILKMYTCEEVEKSSDCEMEIKLSIPDARSILTQSYNGWQLVKSIVSPKVWMETTYYEEAFEQGWLKFNTKAKPTEIVIYHTKIPGERKDNNPG